MKYYLEDLNNTDKGFIMSLFKTLELKDILKMELPKIRERLKTMLNTLEKNNTRHNDFIYKITLKDFKISIKIIDNFLKI